MRSYQRILKEGSLGAEPASASSAVLMLNQKPSVRQYFSANGNCSLGLLSHFAAQCKDFL
jgi:hypothetical protein